MSNTMTVSSHYVLLIGKKFYCITVLQIVAKKSRLENRLEFGGYLFKKVLLENISIAVR